MKTGFLELIPNQLSEELQEYIVHRSNYTIEIVEAAITEMQKRGRKFSEEELATFKREFQHRREVLEEQEFNWSLLGNQWKKNVVTDDNAPAYYSQKAIYFFSILFSLIFGAILFATNFRSTESKKGVWEVVTFGILFTGLQVWGLSLIPRSTGLTLICNIGGAMLMNHLFWEKYIGKDTKYRAKPIWKPLIIGIIISIPFILAIIYGGADN